MNVRIKRLLENGNFKIVEENNYSDDSVYSDDYNDLYSDNYNDLYDDER